MTSSYLAIWLLKRSPLPEKQLRIFLSHLSPQSLTEYLSKANIYKKKTSGRRKMTNWFNWYDYF